VTGRAPADVFIYRRRTAPVRYVTTQEKILKNSPVPGRLSNWPVISTSLKSYDISFICDHSIKARAVIWDFFKHQEKHFLKAFVEVHSLKEDRNQT